MGAGWQRWWRRPRTLEEAYEEGQAAAGMQRKGWSFYIPDFKPAVFELKPIAWDPEAAKAFASYEQMRENNERLLFQVFGGGLPDEDPR